MKETNRVVAGLARGEDTNEILELNTSEYGPSDIIATRMDFAWRHDQNPVGRAIIPVIRNDRERVVGFIWIVPVALRIRGQDYLAATGTNLVIHPKYRNTFSYTKLIRKFEQVFKDENIPLHFSFVSERVYQERRKHAPQSVGTVPLLVRLLDLESLAQAYSFKDWQRLVTARINPLVSPFFSGQRLPASDPRITTQIIDKFSEEFDQFWSSVQDKYPVIVIRNYAYLAWRFAIISERRCHIVVARVGEEIVGYAVLRCTTIRGIKTGLIMDLLVTQDSLGEAVGACLMAEAETYFRVQGMSLVLGLMASFTTEYRILRQAGYLYLPQILAPRLFRFAFFVHNNDRRELISLSTQDWFITLADYESF